MSGTAASWVNLILNLIILAVLTGLVRSNSRLGALAAAARAEAATAAREAAKAAEDAGEAAYLSAEVLKRIKLGVDTGGATGLRIESAADDVATALGEAQQRADKITDLPPGAAADAAMQSPQPSTIIPPQPRPR